MWTNSLLKQNARQNLKHYYWTGLGVLAVIAVMCIGVSYILGFAASIAAVPFLPELEAAAAVVDDPMNVTEEEFYQIMEAAWPLYLVMLCLGTLAFIFFMNVIMTGQNRFYYQARNGRPSFGNLFWSFQEGRYGNTVKAMLLRLLNIVLWTCLLVVPGIVKYYESFLVPYLLAENGNLSAKRAFEISKQTMKGEKFKCFRLQFSFIGWWFLVTFGIYTAMGLIVPYYIGILAVYVGIAFVILYYQASMTEFYACMRAKMTSYHFTAEEELTGWQNQNEDKYISQNPYDHEHFQNPPYQSRPEQHQNEESPYAGRVNLEKKPPSDNDDNQQNF